MTSVRGRRSGVLFDQWNGDGTLDAILGELIGEVQINEDLWCIDGTTVRAHKCAAGGGKKKGIKTKPAGHALGRSRGGFEYEDPPAV